MSARVLVFTASVGEGHDVPARAIAAGIAARRPDVDVEIVDALDALGGLVHRVAEDGMRRTFGSGRAHWLFDLEHLVFARFPPGRAAGRFALHRIAGPGVAREIAIRAPDLVVSTYPAMTDVLGHLRRTRHLAAPAVAAVTDLSSLWYWVAPGIDRHLVTHPESIAEAERLGGRDVRVAAGMYDERFLDPPSRDDARRLLELPRSGAVVAVSGGGWGVGDIAGACHAALDAGAVSVLCLCGRNEALRAQIEAAFTIEGRVRALPFVADMVTTLAAADALVHSTAGLTVLEALLVGTRPVSYGWGIGHISTNNRAFRRFGLAEVAATPEELRVALRRVLTEPRRPLAPAFAQLPHAADLILELLPGPDAEQGQ